LDLDFTDFTLTADAGVRVLAAMVLGAFIGLERETSEQPAGLRTHIAVCVGAALFGVISTLGFDEFEDRRSLTNIQIDVTRVASQVVVGIGFLGAGMIFRQGTVVRNLTTAASLWVTSAIGLAAGVGDIGIAAVTTAIVLVSLALLRPLREWIRRTIARDERRVRITVTGGIDPREVAAALRSLADVDIEHLHIDKDRGAYVLVAQLRAEPHVDLDELLQEFVLRDDVESMGDDFGGTSG
jgi:putative Mg2+ transporter-C (MgtC) family protein